MKFLIITGMSGAGKSEALNFFEDQGFFCVDNLPPALLSKFAELCLHSQIKKIVVVIDIRGGEFFDSLFNELKSLNQKELNFDILFLEATDRVLISRFKETRRRHPLDDEGRVLDAIQKERELMEELRGKAHKIINTSELDKNEFYNELESLFAGDTEIKKLSISIISFGFKYGVPLDADMVFDVRFLPNPHYVNTLKDKTGKDKQVRDYIFKWPLTEKFNDKFFDFMEFLLPEYEKEGKSHLGIAIGCTGGKHRSVSIADKLKKELKDKEYQVTVEHRDINK